MKKYVSLILVIVILAASLTACAGEPIKMHAVVEGSIFGGKSDDKIEVEVSFDPRRITSRDNTKYDPDLAQFCVLLSSDSYFRAKDLDKGRQNRVLLDGNSGEEYEMTSFLSAFGFTETEHYESFSASADPTDSNDSVTLNIGHQTVDGKYDVYAVVIRGCFSWQEWCSAFDPGCTDEKYEELTGEHPDWTHKEYLKGIDVAANRALAFIESFMSENNDETLPDRILITGHSRGGTIANVLGAYFEKETDVKSYTYTFNSVPVARVDDAGSYRTIFNVFDEGDFFTDPFPFENGKFYRFGTDITASVTDNDTVKTAIADLKGRDDYLSVPKETADEYRRLFAERFPDREKLCETETLTFTYDTEEAAAKGREELAALVGAEAGLGLEDLCRIGDTAATADGKYSVTVEYCGLTWLRSYAKILAYGEAAYAAVVKLFAGDEIGCRIAKLIAENAAGINGGHLLANTYAVAGAVTDK